MTFFNLLRIDFSTENCLLKSCNFIKKKLQRKCFPVKFAKFLRASILKNICEGLLLYYHEKSDILPHSLKRVLGQ